MMRRRKKRRKTKKRLFVMSSDHILFIEESRITIYSFPVTSILAHLSATLWSLVTFVPPYLHYIIY